jgi:hypothetical protein
MIEISNLFILVCENWKMAAVEEYWCEGDPKQFMSSLPKELRFGNLSHPYPSYPKNLRDLLQQKKIRRTRTLDGVVRVSNTIAYSFHTVVVIMKGRLRGTSTPTAIHLIMKHTPWTEIVFYAEGYSSHHNYFSNQWTSEMFDARDLQICATIKKSGEHIKLFHFQENSELRKHLGPYLVVSKGSFNQRSSYIQKALTYLKKCEENLVNFLDEFQVETMFFEMMVGDQHVFSNSPDTPAFYVHAIRTHNDTKLLPNSTSHSWVRNDVIQGVPVVGTYESWIAFLEAYGRMKDDPKYSKEEGLYAHEHSTGTAIKFKFPRYLALREMRQSRFGPMHTMDTSYAYMDAMFPNMFEKLRHLVEEYPAIRHLDVSEERKMQYARWIRGWSLHWANLKTFEPDRAGKILGGDFVDELSQFVESVCDGVFDEVEIVAKLARYRPVVYLIMLTGPPGSGKSTQMSQILEGNYGPDSFVWFTQDLLGTRINLVNNVVDFANWTSKRDTPNGAWERQNGIYIVVVDRCNPNRCSRQRLMDEIRSKLGKPTAQNDPLIWTQHCALPLPKNPLETLTKRVMLRKNHPSLTPDMGIISIAEIIDEHFLKSFEPPLTSTDSVIFPSKQLVRSVKYYERLRIPKNAVVAKNKRSVTYAGIVVFGDLDKVAPIEDVEVSTFEIHKTIVHTTLHYFGKNPVETLKNSDDPSNKRIYELCFDNQKVENITGRILGHYIDADLGVAGHLVLWDPLIEVGDTRIYHITTHLKNKESKPFDSNKVLSRTDTDGHTVPLSVSDVGVWDNHGKITWHVEVISLTRGCPGFATSS